MQRIHYSTRLGMNRIFKTLTYPSSAVWANAMPERVNVKLECGRVQPFLTNLLFQDILAQHNLNTYMEKRERVKVMFYKNVYVVSVL